MYKYLGVGLFLIFRYLLSFVHKTNRESSAQMNSLKSAISRLFDRIHFGLLRKKYIDDQHRIASEDFIRWLLKKSVDSLYPAAPYERKRLQQLKFCHVLEM